MLMCYLRVCPFTKAIGQDCTIEKKPEQCCPIITCPEVPVQLVTSSTTEPTPPAPSGAGGSTSGTTAVGRPDNYGCTIDSEFYADGAKVPGDPSKPCELCYCIRNRTACVMQECTLNVEGCEPVLAEGVCCPIRYECDYQEKPTTAPTTPRPTPGLILATTPGPLDCAYNSDVYSDGEKLPETNPCEFCYCMKGDIVCAVQECGAPLATEGRNCTALPPQPGSCCPQQYLCDNGTLPLDVMNQQKPSGAQDSDASSSSSTAAPSDDAPSATPTPAPTQPPTQPPTSATPVEPSLDDNEVDSPGAAAVEAEDDQQQQEKEPELSKPIDDSVAESSTTHDHVQPTHEESKPEEEHNQVESDSGSVDEQQATTSRPDIQPVEADTAHPDIHVEESTDAPLQKPESDDHVKPDAPVTPIGEILPTEQPTGEPGVIISQDTPSEAGESEQAKPSGEDTTHLPGFPSNEAVESETGAPEGPIGVTGEEHHTPAIISQDEEQVQTTAGPSIGEEQTQEQQTSLPPQEPVVSEGEEQSPLIPTEGSIEKETEISTTSAPHASSAKPADDVPESPTETTLAPAIDQSQGPALPPQAVESEEQPGTAAPEHHTQVPIESDYVTEQSSADITTISQQEEEKIPESPEVHIPSVPEETQEHVTSSSEQSQEHVTSSSEQSQEHVTSSSDESQEHVTSSSEQSQEHVTSSSGESQEHFTSSSDESQVHVTSSSDESLEHVTGSSDGSEEHVTSSNEGQEHVTSSSDISEEHEPTSSGQSPEHEPSSPAESQEHIPSTPDHTQQPLPSPDDNEASGEPGASSVSEIDHSPEHPSSETTALPIEGDVTTTPQHHEQLPVEAETSKPVDDSVHPTLPSLDDEQSPEEPQKPEESNTIIPESGSETQEQELPSSKPDVQPVEAETSHPDVHIEESTDAPLQKPESDDHIKPEAVQPVDITTEQAIGEPAVTSQFEHEAEKPSEVEHVKPEEPSHTTSQPSSFNTEAVEAATGAPDFPVAPTLAPEQPSSAGEDSSAVSQGEDQTEQQTEQPSAAQVPAEETDEQQTSRPPVEADVNEIEIIPHIPTEGSDVIQTTSSPHIPSKPADDIPETPIKTTLAPEIDQSQGGTFSPEAVESEGAEAGTSIPEHQTDVPIESDYVTEYEHPAPEITTVSEQEEDKIPSIPQENIPSIPAQTGENVPSSEIEQEGSGDVSEATTIGASHPEEHFGPESPEAVEVASESSQPEHIPTEAEISQPDDVPSLTTLPSIDHETTGSEDIHKPDDAQETATGSAQGEFSTPSIISGIPQGEEDKIPVDDSVTDAPLPEGSGSSSDNEVPQSSEKPVISEDEHGDHNIHTVQPETEKPVMTVEAVEAETSAPHEPETTEAAIAETTIIPQAETSHPPAPVDSIPGEEISTGKPPSGSDDQHIIPSTDAPSQSAESDITQSVTEISQEGDSIAATTNAPVQQAIEHETDEDVHPQPPATAPPSHPSPESSSPADVSTESSMKVTEKVDEDQSSEMISGGIAGATEAPIPGPEGIPGPSDVEPPHGIIPGEGNCLVEGQTYENNSVIPPMNPCVLSCRCASSIVHCVKVSCSPPPPGHNCVPVKEKSDSCCETYLCDGNSTPTLESDNHMGVTTPEDGKLPQSSTYPSVEEHPTIVESDEFVPEAVEAEKPEASDTSESTGDSQGTVDHEKPYPDEQVPEQGGGTEPIEHPSQPEAPISEGDNISQHPEEHPSLENEVSSTDAPSVPVHPSEEAEEQKPVHPQQEDELATTSKPSVQSPETEAPVESHPSVTSGPVLPIEEESVSTEQSALPDSPEISQQATESNLPVEPVVEDTSGAAPAQETDQSSGSEQSATELPVQPVEAEQSQPDHEHETPIEHTPEESHTTLSPTDEIQEHVTGVSEDSAVSHPDQTIDEITQKPSHEVPDQKPSEDVPGTTESVATEDQTSHYPSEEHIKPSEGETPALIPAEPSESESASGSPLTEQSPIEQDLTEKPEIEQTQTSEPGLSEVEHPSHTEEEQVPPTTEAGSIVEPSATDKPKPGEQEPVIIASDELTTLAPESEKPAEEEISTHPLPVEAETTEAEKPPAPGQIEASEADIPESTEKLPVETPAQPSHEEPQSTLAPEEHASITTSVPDVTIAVEHGDGGHPLEGDSMTLEEESKPSSEKPAQLPVESDSVTEHKPEESEPSVTLPPAEAPPPSIEQDPETLPEAEHPQKPSEDVPESTEQSPPEVAQENQTEIEQEAESGTQASSGQEVEASEEEKPVTGGHVPETSNTESSISHETQKPVDVQPIEADSSSTDLPQEAEHPLPGITSSPDDATHPPAQEETSHIISSDEESLPTTQHPESVTTQSSSVPQASEDTISESATALPSLPSEAEDIEGQKPEEPSSGSSDTTTLPPALPSENEEEKPAKPSISPEIVTSLPALPSEAETSDVEDQKPEEPSFQDITTSPPALPSEAETSEAEEQKPEAPSAGSFDSTTLPSALPSEAETSESDDHKPDEPSLVSSDAESTPLPALPSEAEEQKPEEPSSGVDITTSAPSLPSETASPEAEGQKPEEQSSVSFDSVTPEAQHPQDVIPTTDSALEIQTDNVPSQTPGSVEPSVVGEEEQIIHQKPEEPEQGISEDEVAHGTQAPSEQLPSEDHGEPESVESTTQDSTGIHSSSVEPALAETDSEDGKPAEETQTDDQLPSVSGADSEHDPSSSVTETSSPVEHATIPGEGLDDSSKKPSPHPVPVSPDSSSPPPVDQKPHLPPHPGPDYENFNPDDGWGYPPTSDEDWSEGSFGPGTCRYGGKLYVSAQQIPRDDPCDFCFCFRSDIICLRQSCPPPIPDCHQEPIDGFCCPRYQCEVSTATMVNVSTTTTTTTTTLPPHFLSHAYNGSAVKEGCMVDGKTFKVGEKITAKSTPCLECLCGRSGEMNCNPKECQPEPMLRKMIMAAASRRR